MNAITEQELLEALPTISTHRETLYLNEKRVREQFDLRLGGISQLVQSSKLQGELGGKITYLFMELTGKLGKERAVSVQRQITPVMMAALLEYFYRKSRILKLIIMPTK